MSQVELKLPGSFIYKGIFFKNYLLFTFKCYKFVLECEIILSLILNLKALNQQCQANNFTIKNLY
jgi:hypothetical protein